MKKCAAILFVTFVACLAVGPAAFAVPIHLGINTAPNVYGSPAWPAFRDAQYAALYNGTFVNQANSTDPANIGTYNYASADYLVYSFGDLGRRLHAFYYVAGETTTTLAAKNFQVSIRYQWDGAWHNPYVEYGWGDWVTPTSWINYDGNGDGKIDGVMGSMGNAMWGAEGFTSDTAAATAQLAADLLANDLHLGVTQFMVRVNDGGQQTVTIQADHTPVPEPATLSLLGLGLAGLARAARKRQK